MFMEKAGDTPVKTIAVWANQMQNSASLLGLNSLLFGGLTIRGMTRARIDCTAEVLGWIPLCGTSTLAPSSRRVLPRLKRRHVRRRVTAAAPLTSPRRHRREVAPVRTSSHDMPSHADRLPTAGRPRPRGAATGGAANRHRRPSDDEGGDYARCWEAHPQAARERHVRRRGSTVARVGQPAQPAEGSDSRGDFHCQRR